MCLQERGIDVQLLRKLIFPGSYNFKIIEKILFLRSCKLETVNVNLPIHIVD